MELKLIEQKLMGNHNILFSEANKVNDININFIQSLPLIFESLFAEP